MFFYVWRYDCMSVSMNQRSNTRLQSVWVTLSHSIISSTSHSLQYIMTHFSLLTPHLTLGPEYPELCHGWRIRGCWCWRWRWRWRCSLEREDHQSWVLGDATGGWGLTEASPVRGSSSGLHSSHRPTSHHCSVVSSLVLSLLLLLLSTNTQTTNYKLQTTNWQHSSTQREGCT